MKITENLKGKKITNANAKKVEINEGNLPQREILSSRREHDIEEETKLDAEARRGQFNQEEESWQSLEGKKHDDIIISSKEEDAERARQNPASHLQQKAATPIFNLPATLIFNLPARHLEEQYEQPLLSPSNFIYNTNRGRVPPEHTGQTPKSNQYYHHHKHEPFQAKNFNQQELNQRNFLNEFNDAEVSDNAGSISKAGELQEGPPLADDDASPMKSISGEVPRRQAKNVPRLNSKIKTAISLDNPGQILQQNPEALVSNNTNNNIEVLRAEKSERRPLKIREAKFADKRLVKEQKFAAADAREQEVHQGGSLREQALQLDQQALAKVKEIMLGFEKMTVIAYNGNEAGAYCAKLSSAGLPQGFGAIAGVDYYGTGLFDENGQILMNKNSVFSQNGALFRFEKMPVNPAFTSIAAYAKEIYPHCQTISSEQLATNSLPAAITTLNDNKLVCLVHTKKHSFVLILKPLATHPGKYELLTLDNGSIPEVMGDPDNEVNKEAHREYSQALGVIIKKLSETFDIEYMSNLQISFAQQVNYERVLGSKSSLFSLNCCDSASVNILNNLENILAMVSKDREYKSNYEIPIANLAVIDKYKRPIAQAELAKGQEAFINEYKIANKLIKKWIYEWPNNPTMKENLKLLQELRETELELPAIVKIMKFKTELPESLKKTISVNKKLIEEKNPTWNQGQVWTWLANKITKHSLQKNTAASTGMFKQPQPQNKNSGAENITGEPTCVKK